VRVDVRLHQLEHRQRTERHGTRRQRRTGRRAQLGVAELVDEQRHYERRGGERERFVPLRQRRHARENRLHHLKVGLFPAGRRLQRAHDRVAGQRLRKIEIAGAQLGELGGGVDALLPRLGRERRETRPRAPALRRARPPARSSAAAQCRPPLAPAHCCGAALGLLATAAATAAGRAAAVAAASQSATVAATAGVLADRRWRQPGATMLPLQERRCGSGRR
jgi:hypothetical protein